MDYESLSKHKNLRKKLTLFSCAMTNGAIQISQISSLDTKVYLKQQIKMGLNCNTHSLIVSYKR